MRGFVGLWTCPQADNPERQHEMKKPSLFQTPTSKQADQAPASVTETKPTRSPSREGKRVLSIYLKPEAWKQLRMLSVNLETSTQGLGEEAINLLFEKHRLNRIA